MLLLHLGGQPSYPDARADLWGDGADASLCTEPGGARAKVLRQGLHVNAL